MTARVLLVLPLIALAACAGTRQRLSEVGKPPAMTATEDPTTLYGRQPVLWPVATAAGPDPRASAPNSLWRADARTFFGDPRASKVGDIVTVEINIDDQAQLNNATSRSREAGDDVDLTNILGLNGGALGRLLPPGANLIDPIDIQSEAEFDGEGTINRSEAVRLTVAAVVTQVLPGGNLAVAGRQEVRINHELRELTVTGVVRPMDITAGNTVPHTQMAEARISYGGRGTLSTVQTPKAGQEVLEILFPF